MSFSDIFRSSFLEGYSGDISMSYYLLIMSVTCALGLYLFFIYRIITRKTFYSKNMNISLVALAIIIAAIIVTIQSSIVISLGMVGALSIVRFRTAIKDPMDLTFLFWAISIGIICGAGLLELAVATSIILTVAVFGLNWVPVAKAPMMLVINTSDLKAESEIIEIVKKYSKFYKVKSRNYTKVSLDFIIEVRVKEEGSLVEEIAALAGIELVSLISHDGEVTF